MVGLHKYALHAAITFPYIQWRRGCRTKRKNSLVEIMTGKNPAMAGAKAPAFLFWRGLQRRRSRIADCADAFVRSPAQNITMKIQEGRAVASERQKALALEFMKFNLMSFVRGMNIPGRSSADPSSGERSILHGRLRRPPLSLAKLAATGPRMATSSD